MTDLANFLQDGGQSDPKSAKMIMTHFGWSRRRLYKEVADARTSGELIMSDYGGHYFLCDPDTPEGKRALRIFSKRTKNEAISLFAVSKAARALVKEFDKNEQ